MYLFPPAWPLELFAIDIVGPLKKMNTGNRFIFLMPDRFSKPTIDTPTTKATATTVVTIFIHDWISNFGITSKLFTDNSPQFTFNTFRQSAKN